LLISNLISSIQLLSYVFIIVFTTLNLLDIAIIPGAVHEYTLYIIQSLCLIVNSYVLVYEVGSAEK